MTRRSRRRARRQTRKENRAEPMWQACSCGKGLYRNRAAAIAARSRAMANADDQRRPCPALWFYPCPSSSGWHLTSSPPRTDSTPRTA